MDREEPYSGLKAESLPWLLLPSLPGPQRENIFHSLVSRPPDRQGQGASRAPKDGKSLFGGLGAWESSWSQHRQRRLQDPRGKERKELSP